MKVLYILSLHQVLSTPAISTDVSHTSIALFPLFNVFLVKLATHMFQQNTTSTYNQLFKYVFMSLLAEHLLTLHVNLLAAHL